MVIGRPSIYLRVKTAFESGGIHAAISVYLTEYPHKSTEEARMYVVKQEYASE